MLFRLCHHFFWFYSFCILNSMYSFSNFDRYNSNTQCTFFIFNPSLKIKLQVVVNNHILLFVEEARTKFLTLPRKIL